MSLTPRQQRILELIIRLYLEYGEPIGSKVIANEVGVSSATVRNEMAFLTENGYLEQPHTSAGRIPSAMGFRAHIKNNDEIKKIDIDRLSYFDAVLNSSDPEQAIIKASLALSYDYTCLITTPGGLNSLIKTVQFVQISRRSAMLILMTSSGTAKNQIFRSEFDLNPDMLRIFFRTFNQRLMGKRLSEITPIFLQNFAISLGDMSILMSSALMALFEATQETAKPQIIVNGHTNLFLKSNLSDQSILKISELIQSPEVFRNSLINMPSKNSIIIGGDPIFPLLKDTGIVSTKYFINGQTEGIISVIGPTRMDYPKVIQEINHVASYVGKTLSDFLNETM